MPRNKDAMDRVEFWLGNKLNEYWAIIMSYAGLFQVIKLMVWVLMQKGSSLGSHAVNLVKPCGSELELFEDLLLLHSCSYLN